jgi:pyruvate/2-oxoacid:ferredoxin oxidoreductase beta subunit
VPADLPPGIEDRDLRSERRKADEREQAMGHGCGYVARAAVARRRECQLNAAEVRRPNGITAFYLDDPTHPQNYAQKSLEQTSTS